MAEIEVKHPEASERSRQRAAFKLHAYWREKAEALTKSLFPNLPDKSVDLDMVVRVWSDCFAMWTAFVEPRDVDAMIANMIVLMRASRAHYRKTHSMPPDPIVPQDFRLREGSEAVPMRSPDDKLKVN